MRILNASRSADFELDVLDAHLLAGFLVVVKPVPFSQVDSSELCARIYASGFPVALWSKKSSASTSLSPICYPRATHIRLELGELQSSAINSDDVLQLRWALLWVGFGSVDDVGRVFSLAVLASPDEIGFASAAGLLVLLLKDS